MVDATGWLRGIHLALNGVTVTAGEMHDYFTALDEGFTWCQCAPGLGYRCPMHQPTQIAELVTAANYLQPVYHR